MFYLQFAHTRTTNVRESVSSSVYVVLSDYRVCLSAELGNDHMHMCDNSNSTKWQKMTLNVHTRIFAISSTSTTIIGSIIVPVSYTHLDVYKRQNM